MSCKTELYGGTFTHGQTKHSSRAAELYEQDIKRNKQSFQDGVIEQYSRMNRQRSVNITGESGPLDPLLPVNLHLHTWIQVIYSLPLIKPAYLLNNLSAAQEERYSIHLS